MKCRNLTGLEIARKHNPVNINPERLGFVCKNGTINFPSAEAAGEYAKNKAVQALRIKRPYERIIIQSKNQILDEIQGDLYQGEIDPSKYKEKIVIIHGHPDTYADGCTAPVSGADYMTLKEFSNIDSIIAYNSKGEYSMLTKRKSGFAFWDFIIAPLKSVKEYILYQQEFIKIIKELTPPKILKRKQYLAEKLERVRRGKSLKCSAEMEEELKKINLEQERLQSSQKGVIKIHNLWRTKDKKLGVEYSTNFSNLI